MSDRQRQCQAALLTGGKLLILGIHLFIETHPFDQIQARGNLVVGTEEAHGLPHLHIAG